LPRWRTRVNPWRSRIAHVSCPDRTRSLPTGHLDLRDEHFIGQALLGFRGGGTFKEQLKRLAEAVPGRFDGVSLTCDVQFGAKGHEPIPFAVNNCRQSLAHMSSRHSPAL